MGLDAVEKKRSAAGSEPDIGEHCPNCGARGQWQKCKLICTNPKCGVRIILACVD